MYDTLVTVFEYPDARVGFPTTEQSYVTSDGHTIATYNAAGEVFDTNQTYLGKVSSDD